MAPQSFIWIWPTFQLLREKKTEEKVLWIRGMETTIIISLHTPLKIVSYESIMTWNTFSIPAPVPHLAPVCSKADRQVDGESGQVAGQRPQVQVMNTLHLGYLNITYVCIKHLVQV